MRGVRGAQQALVHLLPFFLVRLFLEAHHGREGLVVRERCTQHTQFARCVGYICVGPVFEVLKVAMPMRAWPRRRIPARKEKRIGLLPLR